MVTKTKFDESFGIIPLRKFDAVWHVYLVQHVNGFWGFPKGHLEIGETAQACAQRELTEETGLHVAHFLVHEPVTEEFVFIQNGQEINKKVTYFLAEVSDTAVPAHDHEIMAGQWATIKDSAKIMTYKTGKQVCKNIARLLRKK